MIFIKTKSEIETTFIEFEFEKTILFEINEIKII